MIIQKARAKNFLSIGNGFLEFDVQKYDKTVISGKNGSSKSALGSIITFGLFGQVIKNINKAQIVNSINGKQCLVEIEFESNSNSYIIRRGIKPNVFQVIENGVPLQQTNSSDFQDFLEKNILRTNFKTFVQTSILSVENYKPFMTLRAHERREFIEDVLDIKVFTYMNKIVKTKITKNAEELKLLGVQVTNAFNKANMQKQHIAQIEAIKSNSTDQIKAKIAAFESEKAGIVFRTEELQEQLTKNVQVASVLSAKVKEHSAILTAIDKLEKFISDSESKLDSLSNDVCPVCSSVIHESTKSDITDPIETQIKTASENAHVLVHRLSEFENVSSDLQSTNEIISCINSKIASGTSLISKLSEEILSLKEEILNSNKIEELSDMKAELKQTAIEALEFKRKQADLKTDQQYNELMLEMFKDSGIKSNIVNQYIPVINSLINMYLEKLDFFVSFHLDSEFNESIKSRHRDEFTYGSFSAGERTKIDIALLFTFRQLAKLRNAFDCNMLFIDEILEFLDESGTTNFLSMIESLDEFKKSNIFIISHKLKDQLAEVFAGHYKMHKELGFSILEDVSSVS